jgi:mono/diheme cytochrome c family protein
VLPEEKNKDKTGAELYDMMFGETSPAACSNCHADWTDNANPKLDKFMVYVLEGSTRTEKNWLERSAAEQERIVAFGAHSVLADGTALTNMASYKRVLSRAEIEKVVAHLRTLTPMIKVMKTKDKVPVTTGSSM